MRKTSGWVLAQLQLLISCVTVHERKLTLLIFSYKIAIQVSHRIGGAIK